MSAAPITPFILYADAQFTSPYALSVFVTLREKGLPFELRTVDLALGANHESGFADLSITRRVPTLVHGDFTLSESSAITEYLETISPAVAVYPADVRELARARQVQAWLRSDLAVLRQERSTEFIYYGPTDQPLSDAGYAAASKLIAIAQSLLPDGRMSLFDKWCIADVDLALMLNRLVYNDDVVPSELAEYARLQFTRPAVQEWIAMSRPPRPGDEGYVADKAA
ncbi:glutathione transferase [Pandoraea norimbergensis]|uniref:Glutathione S-transferase n=1 Tax=Pandoraea norimbergensis TaxID=93219 RepID=A0ABN4JH78_9BURK|nr:glutathione transferase [Pandoraea norimbergensis]ALS60309.1 glutathione S-transferase [Pandoraea norimbergensis]